MPLGSSPHTRGARRSPGSQYVRSRIIPAYAGSTPFVRSCPLPAGDHPRIRGEHGPRREARVMPEGSSPHTRGAPPTWPSSSETTPDHPRIRGEHDIITATGCRPWGSSPHTRGARHHHRHRGPPLGIIPAYAGSTRAVRRQHERRRDHPRIRGEHSCRGFRLPSRRGSSPHTRGAPWLGWLAAGQRGIIPAYAGSTPAPTPSVAGEGDHPRIRGEHFTLKSIYSAASGSSPHTRGALHRNVVRVRQRGIIPAYAGSTSLREMIWLALRDHPRIRGEHGQRHDPKGDFTGSSPHTRGARAPSAMSWRTSRIIPAYAGSTPCGTPILTECRDHPRIRGEHDKDPYSDEALAGSSPHTRGAPTPTRWGSCSRGIIPAYAGSTRCRTRRRERCRDHPRIRGEHGLRTVPNLRKGGSSPHTRGAPRPLSPPPVGSRIIPAYAGSTPAGRRPRRGPPDHPRIRGEH